MSRIEELRAYDFRVTLDLLQTQGLGWGSRLLRVVGLWLRSFRRRVWVQGCLGFRVWVENNALCSRLFSF